MLRLRKRQDFLALRDGRRANAATLTLQARRRPDGADAAAGEARAGFTVTKKTGGAVERNRIRRRLRAAMRLAAALHARPGHDYVVIGRRAALDAPFAAILTDLETAFGRVGEDRDRSRRRPAERTDEADR
jgi:ribonuclease P protein component